MQQDIFKAILSEHLGIITSVFMKNEGVCTPLIVPMSVTSL